MKSLKSLKNIKGKTILVRVDFNVPIKDGVVVDDFRIQKALPTIKFLLDKGAKLVLITHLGKDGSASLEPVIARFFKLAKLNKNQKSQITFYENIRKFEGEEANDKNFAKELASLGDFYVNDAFSVSHRNHASLVGIPKYLPSYAGFQLEMEVKHLSRVLKPKHPFLFILGGAKFSTKMPLIKKYLKIADYVFIGGALLSDVLETEGYEVGISLVDDSVSISKNMLKNKKFILPTDVVVQNNNILTNKKINEIAKDDAILDIGKDSIKTLEPYIKKSKLILWNGPLGKYEDKGGDVGTLAILKLIAKSKGESIIGGGDTVELISEKKMEKKFTFVSTGGGATLDFLATGTLPAIKALK